MKMLALIFSALLFMKTFSLPQRIGCHYIFIYIHVKEEILERPTLFHIFFSFVLLLHLGLFASQ